MLEVTAYMFENAAEKKPTLNLLYRMVRDIAGEGFSDREIELAAQIIAASTLGLIVKLSLEKNIDEYQKNKIIDRFTETVVRMASLEQGKPETRE